MTNERLEAGTTYVMAADKRGSYKLGSRERGASVKEHFYATTLKD